MKPAHEPKRGDIVYSTIRKDLGEPPRKIIDIMAPLPGGEWHVVLTGRLHRVITWVKGDGGWLVVRDYIAGPADILRR